MLWADVLAAEKQQPYFLDLLAQVEQARASGKVIYPPSNEVFNAFKLTPLAQLKVVILGQDPYHGPNQAHGLAFSVRAGVKVPPSLRNIYKELALEYADFAATDQGCLQRWAEQGVLLLNTVLTVEANSPNSHQKLGWEPFTDFVIQQISAHCEQVVFLLWGSHAQKKARLIDAQRHHILTAPHPSPLSAHRGFFGCGHFLQTNSLLTAAGKTPINWHAILAQ
ncbi:uracil-DNA glycosylase [Rheinheimera sp. UJ51]|uniref:uracil-DNA glycosylase n=1 Tax=unclassified Rheinheimera TaxID=115860 RepID=UPI001E51D3B1|nr:MULTISPECIES: uracil-DNA glycosylase [unclassified Rheinheimera]MCC5451423.1 uracil-DNA glycosylase [Rheinheimera sp. UJ51]MCF4008236.1 uracil-DNA glycosylase [Rheinheimera sp. UJ63]